MPVTADNFTRAESDGYFASVVKDAGGLGKFRHRREMMSIDKQGVNRGNRDTLYSPAVVDLDAGPVTITLPDAGTRFRSMILIDEDLASGHLERCMEIFPRRRCSDCRNQRN